MLSPEYGRDARAATSDDRINNRRCITSDGAIGLAEDDRLEAEIRSRPSRPRSRCARNDDRRIIAESDRALTIAMLTRAETWTSDACRNGSAAGAVRGNEAYRVIRNDAGNIRRG